MSPVPGAPRTLTAPEPVLRGEYLDEVLRLLYPDPCVAGPAHLVPPGRTVARFIVVPDLARARLLVPAGSARLAAAAVARYGRPQTRPARLRRDLAVLALRGRLDRLLLRDRLAVGRPGLATPVDTIDAHLRATLHRGLAVCVHIGPVRANRKPVLQLVSPTGDTFGYAKLGHTPLTARLVRQEASALAALERLAPREVAVPRILHSGTWLGHQLLVQTALPGYRAQPVAPPLLARAMREIAYGLGVDGCGLAGSRYWRDLRERLESLRDAATGPDAGGDAGGDAHALTYAADLLVARYGATELRLGSWHGDWAPWNMAGAPTRVMVWDWERFATGVPVGFDALHHELNRRLADGADATDAVRATLSRAGALLAPFEVAGPDAVRATALLYLVDLAARYLHDRQAQAGARLGVLGTWLLPVLLSEVDTA